MPPTLEKRFEAFLSETPGAESIDALDLPAFRGTGRRADFLLHNRRVIVELKVLKTDTLHKVETAVGRHRDREDFPIFYGEPDLRKVLARLAGGDRIYRRILRAITRSVEDAVRSAEEQISKTRDLLNLPSGIGLLILLNESIDVLAPDLAAQRVAELMVRSRSGRSEAPVLDFAWLLFESHLIEVSAGREVFPSILIRGERAANFPWFDESFLSLEHRWAATNYGAKIDSTNVSPNRFSFVSAAKLKQTPQTHIRRKDLWAREYDAHPHLRALSDSEILAHGAKIIRDLAPYFLKGGSPFSREAVAPLLREFTCLIQEANYRGLDMRDLPKP